MKKFLRISHLYPKILEDFKKKYPDLSNKSYQETLKLLHEEKYSVSNFYSKALKKLKYKCKEIISNAEFLQKKWIYERNGKEVDNFNILLEQIKHYRPDIVYVGNADLCTKYFISNIKKISTVKLVLGYHCAPFNKKILQNLSNVDAVVTCTYGYLKTLKKKINKNILFLPHAFQDVPDKFKYKRNIDVTFIGSLFPGNKLHSNRIDMIYKLMKNFKNNYIAVNFSNFFLFKYLYFIIKNLLSFNIFNNIILFYKLLFIYFFSKKPVFGHKMYSILKKSKISINSHIGDTEYAGNMRIFEGTGCGCLLMTDKKKGYSKFFQANKEIVIYKNNDDLINKFIFYLKNQKKLSIISKQGQIKTLKKHNYSKRAIFIKKFINQNILKNVF